MLEQQFDALLSLLVDCGVLRRETARALLMLCADKIEAAESDEWMTCSAECRLQAESLRRRAEAMAS